MPMRGELLVPAIALGNPAPASRTAASRVLGAITNPDAIAVIGFCAIGLLVTAGLIHSFPKLNETFALFAQVP